MAARDEARRRVFGTLLMHAVLRWESLITLVLTMVLFFGIRDFQILSFALPAWAWLIFGGVAEAALVMSVLTDQEEAQEALAKEFESKYDLSEVINCAIGHFNLYTCVSWNFVSLNL